MGGCDGELRISSAGTPWGPSLLFVLSVVLEIPAATDKESFEQNMELGAENS